MRTKTLIQHLAVLCAGGMLLACADLFEAGKPSPQATSAADEAYLLGRNQYLAHRYEDAMKSYRKALQADPRHVNANNGMATLYAERRNFGHAIGIWQDLTGKASMASGPGVAFLFSNLGYAEFLNGDYDKALVSLEKACLLDPLNHRAWQHLGETLQKLGQDERARQMLGQAAALREHDLRADYAAAGGAARVPAVESAVKEPPRPDQEFSTAAMGATAEAGRELGSIAPAGPAAPAVVAPRAPEPLPAPPDVPVAPDVALLEIRNGNGVTRMARALSRQIGDPGLKVVRLTNDKGFAVQQTRVEYQGAYRAAAERLAWRIGGATVVEVDNCKPNDVRLVIGHDLARGKFALRPLPVKSDAPTLAAAE
jgi:tetratricopeptide (TPR) repeat protein